MKKGGNWLVLLLLFFGMLLPPGTPGVAEAKVKERLLAKAETKAEKNGGQEAAKEEGKEEGKEEPPATFGPIITDTAVPVEVGALELQPFWSLGFVTHTFDHRGKRRDPRGNFRTFGFDLQITYGAWENLEVYTVIPVVVNWVTGARDPGPHGDRAATWAGFGDVNLTAKYRFVKEGPVWPTISYIFAVDFPTGKYRNLSPKMLGLDAVGRGSYVFTTGFNVSKWVKPFIFYGNLYYSWPTDVIGDEGRVIPRDFITVNLAAEYPITEKWIALLELTSYWDTNRMFGRRSNQGVSNLLSIMPGIEFMATKKLSFALGVNIDLAGRNNNASVTPILSMIWAVR